MHPLAAHTPRDERLGGTGVAGSVIDLIGNTPIVHLRQVSTALALQPLLTIKHEAANPGGSAKDRPALSMVIAAERSGQLHPGGVIVEPTSGNTGVGLAIVAAQRGYRCVFVVTDKVAPEKIALLRAYGAEVVVCPVAVAPDDPRSYYSVAAALEQQYGAFRPNQYENPHNPAAHEHTTGVEIVEQTRGRITHFVAGAGTSGTITGVARTLRRLVPDAQIIVADPVNSVFNGGSGRPYLVEGVGEDFYPAAWEPSLYDRIIPVSDERSFATARMVTRTEGILVGGSGGLAIAAGIDVAREIGSDGFIVVLNPDSGRGYLSRVYDDNWMLAHGFVDEDGEIVRAHLRDIDRDGRALYHLTPTATVAEAIAHLTEHHLDAAPVVEGTWPIAAAEVTGSVSHRGLSQHLSDGGGRGDPVSVCLEPALVYIGAGMTVARASNLLIEHGTGVVYDGGAPVRTIDYHQLTHAAAH